MKLLTAFILFLTCFTTALAGKVDTIEIFSTSMNRSIRTVVIIPDNYNTVKTRFPVVYLLHGYDGDYSNWVTKVPRVKDHADNYQCIIVCPDGAISSWYLDSPVDPAYRYETFTSMELVQAVDKRYRTIPDKKHRAITGLSMGGHGALFIGLRHSDSFGAAGSLSGCADLWEIRKRYEIGKRIGDTVINAKYWQQYAIVNLVEAYPRTDLKMIFDCGINDMFIGANRRLHQKMLQLNIPHTYTERPGNHSWDYWSSNIEYHFLYFRNYFNEK